jgi:Ca2+-binding EF-hand superfamily protein
MTEWGELLVRRRSAHDQFERLPSAYNEISQQELEELKASYFLDDKQVDDYIKAFRKYDADKSGDIDNQELALLIKDLGMNFPPADIYDMIQAVDVDGSGSIGMCEFITLMADPDGPLGVALAG